jgi:SAM-dependent methyltransferase
VPASSDFKDHFSDQSAQYARHRPQYPAELFRFLANLTTRTRRAWDCATGSGQAAIALSNHFDEVIATDASAAQIDAAVAHAGVSYRVAEAGSSGLDDASVDLVTVGQALHWFDIESFFAEATRVLDRDGALAVWCYELCKVTETCDAVVDELYTDIVGALWPPERRLIEERYAGIIMPGHELDAPILDMQISWTVADMLGYLRTWSACIRYERTHGRDPVTMIEERLRTAWGSDVRLVRWPLTLRVCRP